VFDKAAMGIGGFAAMKVLLVDDEALALDRLRTLFADIEDVDVVGHATDGDMALEQIEALRPELVILDIQMPGRNGLRTAAALDPEVRPEIIFVTAHEHYAPDAFEVDAADYLLKPVRFDRLRQAVNRARRRRELREQAEQNDKLLEEVEALRSKGAGARKDDEGFWVPERHGQRWVPIASIGWIEAARDYVLLHTETRSHMLRATMSALEEKLDGTGLMRVHRSAFVRPEKVAEVRRANRSLTLVLDDGAHVQVGPSYIDALTEKLGLP
jgi:two-component system, LytTR family, response regulator